MGGDSGGISSEGICSPGEIEVLLFTNNLSSSRYFEDTYPVGNFPSREYSLHPVAIAGLAYILVPLGKDPKILELAFVDCLIFKPSDALTIY
jgi:hypothetical protein